MSVHYSSYINAGPTGEIGVAGSVGPTGPTGPTGSGISGPVGPTGIGVSFADGTADTSLYIQLTDGLEIQHDNVSVRGNPANLGTVAIQNNGTGVSIVEGVSGGEVSFRTLRFTNDYTITRQANDILASVDTTSAGPSSVVAGLKNALIYMSGVTLASGATFTYYGTGGSIAEREFISATLKDYTSVIKGTTGQRVSAANPYTAVPSSRTSLDDANIILIDQNKFQLDNGDLTWKTFYHGPTFNSEYIGSGFGTGPTYSNALYATFVIKTPNHDMTDTNKTGISFEYIEGSKFSSDKLKKDSYNLLNCISVNNGITWDCFQPGSGYTHEYNDLYSPGTCCYELHCYDYVSLEGCSNIGGTYKKDTVCDGTICGLDIMGACCTNDTCLQTSQAGCEKFSGLWFSEQDCSLVPCAPVCSEIGVGACCFPFGQCNDRLSKEYCELFNGTYQGDGVYCWDVDCCEETLQKGACCVGSQCMFVSAPDCYGLDGIYYGANTSCQDVTCCDVTNIAGMCCCSDGTCVDNVSMEYCASSYCTWTAGADCLVDCGDYLPYASDCDRGIIVIDFEESSASIDNNLETNTYLPTMEEGITEIHYQISQDPSSDYDKIQITGITFDGAEYTDLGGPLPNITIKLKGVDSSGSERVETIYDMLDGVHSPLTHEHEYSNLYANSDSEIVVYANSIDIISGGITQNGIFNMGKLLIHINCGHIESSGACCTGISCSMGTEDVCTTWYGGVYLGDGTTCQYDQGEEPPCGTAGGGEE
jgi:hypothetical protein